MAESSLEREALSTILKFDADYSARLAEIAKNRQAWQAIQKAWSDKARQAAAEARRHRGAADDLRNKLSTDHAARAKQMAAIQAHEQAAGAHEHSAAIHRGGRVGVAGAVGAALGVFEAPTAFNLGARLGTAAAVRAGAGLGGYFGAGMLGAATGTAAAIPIGMGVGMGVRALRAWRSRRRARSLGAHADSLSAKL